MTRDITTDRASRRFHQMAMLERQLGLRSSEILDCKARLKELTDLREGLLLRLREAARDEGDLPLFDLDDD